MNKFSFHPVKPAEFSRLFLRLPEAVLMKIGFGMNPDLPDILHNTWHWPVLRICFFFKEEAYILFQACQIEKTWVSLPHFSYGGLFIHEKMHSILPAGIDFYTFMAWSLNQIPKNQVKSNNCFFIHLDELNLNNLNFNLILPDSFPFLRYSEKLGSKYYSGKSLRVIDLNPDEESYFSYLPANVRRKIRRAIKFNLQTETGGIELLNEFYQVYRRNIRKLGSLALPFRFFENLMHQYELGLVRIVLVKRETKNIGAAILLTYMGYAENAWFATLRSGNKYYSSYLLHDTLIRLAIKDGCRRYSFGRSTPGSGVDMYKKQWGAIEIPLFLHNFQIAKQTSGIQKLLAPVLRHLPLFLLKPLDEWVAERIY